MAISVAPTDLPEQRAPGAWSLSALLTIGFLGLTAGIQMSDRGMQAILLSAIQATFTVGDATIGALQGPAGVLVGGSPFSPCFRAEYQPQHRLWTWPRN